MAEDWVQKRLQSHNKLLQEKQMTLAGEERARSSSNILFNKLALLTLVWVNFSSLST